MNIALNFSIHSLEKSLELVNYWSGYASEFAKDKSWLSHDIAAIQANINYLKDQLEMEYLNDY